MAIHQLLENRAFEPEDVQRLVAAYEMILTSLQLKDSTDPLTTEVARLVLEVAETGEREPAMICERTLQRILKVDEK